MLKRGCDFLSSLLVVAREHLRLAQHELCSNLHLASRDLGALVVAALLVQGGFLLLMVGAALMVGRLLEDQVLGFVVVGGSVAGAGLLGVLHFSRKLRGREFLLDTRREMEESRRWILEELMAPSERKENG
ncbi:MAG: phage holin family protein [Acidobacteriota bacterium]